jgi:hypothetical protein
MNQNAAETIREELKARGINNRRVSVKNDGGSLSIKIKDLSICADMVRDIAEKFERVRYCEGSGEILSGGNFFVFVTYDYKAESAVEATPEYQELLAEIVPKVATLTDRAGVSLPSGVVAFLGPNKASLQATVPWSGKVWSFFNDARDLTLEIYKARLQKKA